MTKKIAIVFDVPKNFDAAKLMAWINDYYNLNNLNRDLGLGDGNSSVAIEAWNRMFPSEDEE
jgi:hypothetical protein